MHSVRTPSLSHTLSLPNTLSFTQLAERPHTLTLSDLLTLSQPLTLSPSSTQLAERAKQRGIPFVTVRDGSADELRASLLPVCVME